jgi:hypothetical protein
MAASRPQICEWIGASQQVFARGRPLPEARNAASWERKSNQSITACQRHSEKSGDGWLWKQSAANRSLGSKFPANREMNSEFQRNSTPKAFQVAAKHLRLLPYRLNTHCKELGILIELTANI